MNAYSRELDLPSEHTHAHAPVTSKDRADTVASQWQTAVNLPSFRSLIRSKIRFIAPMVAFYLIFYLGITLLAGYDKTLMTRKVFGAFNVGYLLILGTYTMSWIMSLIYVQVANRRFDSQAARAIEAFRVREGKA